MVYNYSFGVNSLPDDRSYSGILSMSELDGENRFCVSASFWMNANYCRTSLWVSKQHPLNILPTTI